MTPQPVLWTLAEFAGLWVPRMASLKCQSKKLDVRKERLQIFLFKRRLHFFPLALLISPPYRRLRQPCAVCCGARTAPVTCVVPSLPPPLSVDVQVPHRALQLCPGPEPK